MRRSHAVRHCSWDCNNTLPQPARLHTSMKQSYDDPVFASTIPCFHVGTVGFDCWCRLFLMLLLLLLLHRLHLPHTSTSRKGTDAHVRMFQLLSMATEIEIASQQRSTERHRICRAQMATALGSIYFRPADTRWCTEMLVRYLPWHCKGTSGTIGAWVSMPRSCTRCGFSNEVSNSGRLGWYVFGSFPSAAQVIWYWKLPSSVCRWFFFFNISMDKYQSLFIIKIFSF